MSDKEVVEQSNLLDNLLPGDVVLADRGVCLPLTEVKIPPFTKGKKSSKKSKLN